MKGEQRGRIPSLELLVMLYMSKRNTKFRDPLKSYQVIVQKC